MSQCHNVSANNVKMLLTANCLGSTQIRNVTMVDSGKLPLATTVDAFNALIPLDLSNWIILGI